MFSIAARFFPFNYAVLKFHDLQHTLVISGNHKDRLSQFYLLCIDIKLRIPQKPRHDSKNALTPKTGRGLNSLLYKTKIALEIETTVYSHVKRKSI